VVVNINSRRPTSPRVLELLEKITWLPAMLSKKTIQLTLHKELVI